MSSFPAAHGFLAGRFRNEDSFTLDEIHGLTLSYFGNRLDRAGSLFWNLRKIPKAVRKTAKSTETEPLRKSGNGFFDSVVHDCYHRGAWNPEAPAKLEEILDKALEKEPDLRYQSVSDLHADLKRLRRDTASDRTAAVRGRVVLAYCRRRRTSVGTRRELRRRDRNRSSAAPQKTSLRRALDVRAGAREKEWLEPGETCESCVRYHAALGEHDEAMEELERSFDDRDGDLIFLAVDPAYDPLRGDPRFQGLIRRMNFPE